MSLDLCKDILKSTHNSIGKAREIQKIILKDSGVRLPIRIHSIKEDFSDTMNASKSMKFRIIQLCN